MDLARPYADVVPGPRGAVLAVLVRLERPVTIRELARQAHVSVGSASEIVGQLVRAGLVRKTIAGRSALITFNRDHLEAAGVAALIGVRGALIERLEVELSTWEGLAGAWLFGSAARGDGGHRSDIDLLLVAWDDIESERWEDDTSRLTDKVRRWTGNDVQLVEYTLDSFRKLVADHNPLSAAIGSDGIALVPQAQSIQRGLVAR